MTDKKPSLDAAYALQTPDDNKALYADWAASYDTSFAAQMDYQLPAHVARIFLELCHDETPALDVGAGTGLVAQCLGGKYGGIIDALDISPEMLATAASKQLYRSTIVADLTKPLELADEVYRAVVSSGTFTHGHVGPDALDELLRVAAPGALLVLSVNAEHFDTRGFASKFAELSEQISDYRLHPVAIYGDAADEAHRNDVGNIVSFRKIERT